MRPRLFVGIILMFSFAAPALRADKIHDAAPAGDMAAVKADRSAVLAPAGLP